MLKEKVLRAIQDVRPSLQADGGDIELVDVGEDGIVKVRLTGACGSCPMAVMTLKQGVESYLKKVIPEARKSSRPDSPRSWLPREERPPLGAAVFFGVLRSSADAVVEGAVVILVAVLLRGHGVGRRGRHEPRAHGGKASRASVHPNRRAGAFRPPSALFPRHAFLP